MRRQQCPRGSNFEQQRRVTRGRIEPSLFNRTQTQTSIGDINLSEPQTSHLHTPSSTNHPKISLDRTTLRKYDDGQASREHLPSPEAKLMSLPATAASSPTNNSGISSERLTSGVKSFARPLLWPQTLLKPHRSSIPRRQGTYSKRTSLDSMKSCPDSYVRPASGRPNS